MKRMISLILTQIPIQVNIQLPAVILLFMLSISVVPAFSKIEGNKELLKLMARGYQENQEKILTWRGSTDIFHRTEGGSRYNRRVERSSVVFAHDYKLDATRWNWQLLNDTIERKDGRIIKDAGLYYKNAMKKGNRYYSFGPIVPAKMKRPYRLLIDSQEGKDEGLLSDEFNPLNYTYGFERDMPARLMFFYEHADSPSVYKETLTQEGDIVVFEIGSTKTSFVNRYTFDLSKGCSIIAFYSGEEIGYGQWNFEYEKKGGAFVPKQITYKQERNKEGKKTGIKEWEFSFTQNVVNEPIPASEFELDKLGVEPGDIIVDKLIGLRYIYKADLVSGLGSSSESFEQILAEMEVLHDTNMPRTDRDSNSPQKINMKSPEKENTDRLEKKVFGQPANTVSKETSSHTVLNFPYLITIAVSLAAIIVLAIIVKKVL